MGRGELEPRHEGFEEEIVVVRVVRTHVGWVLGVLGFSAAERIWGFRMGGRRGFFLRAQTPDGGKK